MIGQTLSHYRVTAALGAGGMGEVYRATDANLGRDVAIKVLPPEVAQDPERLARFQREAHLLASLNHPHIAAIYGLEEAGGKPFLALELVEGEDLKARLERGAIPVEEALEIAEQIAEALEEAHAKGIVHRDLKPANIKLTPEGKVKVLDFGLAKAWGAEDGTGSSSIDLSQSPTLARTGTLAGVILGTAAYMSPEQASGKGVDKRGDIWSFGVVLFEMLTGQSLYTGETASEVMASVIKEEPAWDRLPEECPPAIGRLLRRCLRKLPRERLQDIGDARLEIQEVQSGTGIEIEGSAADVEALRRSERRGRTKERWAWAAALVAVGVASLLASRSLSRAPPPPPAAHFLLEAPEGQSLASFPVVSPDGSRVVFRARPAPGPTTLWLRPLDSMNSHPLGGTEGGIQPFWSPDGEALAFFAEGEIRRVNLSDGAQQRLAPLPAGGVWGGTWGSTGTLLFADGGMGARLFAVPASGGTATAVTTLDASRGETTHFRPHFLPDGRHFLFAVRSSQPDNAGVFVASLDAPDERRRVLPTASHTIFAAGHLLFAASGTLMAQPIDLDGLQTAGEPTPIASSVDMNTFPPGTFTGLFSASPGGLVAYREATPSRPTQLTWLSREGETLGTLGEPGDFEQMALSPDGRHLVAEIVGDQNTIDLWSFDTARGVASRVTTDDAVNEVDPVWLPDGLELVYSLAGAGGRLVRQGLRAGAPVSPVVEGDASFIPESVAPDGRTLLASSPHTGDVEDFVIWAVPLDGDGAPEAVLRSEFTLDEFQVSPDGRWLAYISQESGRFEVYVEPYRRPGERVRVSTEGGGQPRWREDGKELFYSAGDAVMAVSVEDAETRIEVGTPRKLFDAPPMRPGWDDYAVTSDGKRFLVKVPIGEEPEPRFHVIMNWPSLLE